MPPILQVVFVCVCDIHSLVRGGTTCVNDGDDPAAQVIAFQSLASRMTYELNVWGD